MSEEGGGKMKAKKVHSQSKPYERRKSLFGKVTDTIKEVIAPSWLSDLVKSVKRTSPHKDEDDSKEEPRQEVKSTSQSLMRSRYQRDGPPQFVPLNSNGIPRLSHKATDQSQVNKPPYTTLSRPDDNPSCAWSLTPQTEISHGNADEKMERNDAAPLGNCTRERPKLHHLPESSQTKEKSQVGLGSLPQDDVDQSADEMSQNCNYDESEITMETSHLEKSVTWTEGYKNSRLSRNKPGFDISLFGLPSRNNFLSKSFHESSFYPGKTVYGGASSGSSSSRLNATAPYQTGFPIRQKIKVKPANTSGSATTCSTAQKILETLEKMSTPLSDARKIPVDDDTVLKMSTRSYLTPGSYKKSRSSIGTYLDTRRELQTTGKGPPKSNISMSTSASISKNYQKISTPHVDSKKDENTSKNMPQKSLQDSISLPSSTGLGGGKLKNKKFQQHIPGRKALEEEDVEVEVPNLRTDFTLPVKDMPKFNFLNENVPSRSKTIILDPGNGHQLDPGNGHHPADSPFTFAPPIQKTPTKPGQEPKPTKMNYTFSQPLDADSTAVVKSVTFDIKPDDRKELNFSSPPGFKFGSSLNTPTTSSGALGSSPVLPSAGLKAASELKSGSVMDVLGKLDKSSENNFKGFLPANELKKGSVMDILGKSGDFGDDKPASELKAGSVMEVLGREGKSESTAQPSLSAMFKPEPGSWRCDTCLIVNKADITKCPACQTPKPGKASSATATSLPSLSSIFKTEAGSWNCDVCLVSNKAEVSKCVACQSGKPGAAPQKEADNSLAAKFKKPTGSWDCDTCLVLNKAEATKCIACETPRPGLQSSFTGGFKFGTGSSFSGQKGFVFGNVDSSLVTGDKPSEQESDNKKLTSINKTTESVGSTNNSGNVSSSKGGFIFGISSSASVTSGSQLDTPTNTSVTSSKGGFQFGTSGNTTVPSGFQFGTSTNTSVVPTTGGFKFSASNSTNEAPAASGFQLSNKESSVSSIVKTSTESTTTKLSVTTGFSFGTKDGDKPEKGFKFGTSEAVKSAAPSTGEFKFGVQETSGTGFQFGVKTAANTVTTEGKDGISEASASTFKSIFGVDKAEMQDLYPSGKPAITNQPSSINFGSGAGFTFGTSAQQPSVDLGVDDVKQSKKEDTKPLTSTESTLPTFNFQNNVKSSQKRALDTENGPSDAKKPIFTVNSESSQSKDTGGGFNFSATTPKVPAKFGSNTTSTIKPTPAPGGFNFGQTTTTSASTAPGFGSNTAATGFSFGGANNAEKSNNTPFNVNRASSTPVFGNTAPSTTPAPGTFVFGEPTTTTASTFTFTAQASTNQARAAASPFGTPQSNANGAVFGNSNSTFGNNTGTPSFGNSAPAFGNTAPSGFGTGSTPTPFGGGSTSAPVFGATPVTTTSGFSFSTNQSSFNFSSNVGTPAANGPGVFQFGAKPTENAVPAQPQGATTGFNFSQSQSLTTGTAFNFNASSSNNLFAGQNAVPGMPSPGSFTIGSTGNADQRKIKRAVRKIRR